MGPHGRQIFDAFHDALEMHTPGPQVPINLERDFKLSLESEGIAIGLMSCAWLKAGKSAEAAEQTWETCSPELRERYRAMAERAIQCIDPQVRIDAKEAAAVETGAFIGATPDMTFNTKTWELIAHEAISRYEARLASLRLDGDA